MVNLFATPLGPALVLLLGALTLSFMRRRLFKWVPWATALLAVVVAATLLLWLVFTDAPRQLALAWDPVALPGGMWSWQIEGWNWLAVAILLLLGGVAVLLAGDEVGPASAPVLAATLSLLAAALLFMLSGNLLTLTAGWVMLDVTLGLRATAEETRSRARAWGLSSLSVLLLLAAFLFAGPSGAYQSLSEETAPLTVLALILAALLRCGAYPFDLWLLPRRDRTRSGLISLHLIPPLTGLWLLGKVHSLAGPYWRLQPAWAAVAVLGMLGSGLAAWLAEREPVRVAWVAVSRVSLALLAAAMVPQLGPVAIVWPLVTLTLGVGSLVVGQAIGERWGWRQPSVLALLTLIGLPGTPGFSARLVLAGFASMPPAFWPLGLLALMAESLLVAALLPGPFLLPRQAWQRVALGPVARLLAAAVLLAVPLLIWGLQPPFLARFSGLPAGDPSLRPLLTQLQQVSPLAWTALLLPWAAGALLAWGRKRILAAKPGWQDTLGRVARLEWGHGSLGWVVERTADALRGVGGVAEGEGYLGWLGLAVLLGWLLWNQ